MKNKNLKIGVFVIMTFIILGCEKFLNEKQDQKIVIPETLTDLQALLDAAIYINYGYYPSVLEMSTDDFYVAEASFNNLSNYSRDVYLWKPYPMHEGTDINGAWMFSYRNLLIANTVLDEIDNVQTSELRRKDEIKGAALFYRAYVFYQLAQAYCDQFIVGATNSGLGLPLRTTPDFNEKSRRSTVAETYQQIIEDMKMAIALLPEKSEVPTRPTKLAAQGALAKVYLVMGDYEQSLIYATEALRGNDALIDYNGLNVNASIPIDRFNKETIYYAYSFSTDLLKRTVGLVDSTLYDSYASNDLRKSVYFVDNGNGTYGFKGAYTGLNNNSFFLGITTSELFLIQSECYARMDNVTSSLSILNKLLESRYKKDSYIPYDSMSPEDCLRLVLRERRKELLFRGVRWSDLKRLNRETEFAKTLERKMRINGNLETYYLPPNDPRYNFVIPEEVIIKSGMQQNIR
ncbi:MULTISPECIES: RagB/SusD family nutrient uptake outer membrane protein [Sphingobacterium]|uniref:RagB/SusD family nutrient uptake outer membrane protein n=1 Tax=Sphingobacterium TaxID=28453 RepID=UPI0013DA9AB9|nr:MULTISPECIES: RagB/SusD family nutrient uptake outer membrane protein [unclassified Sphingobacterium]